MPLGERESKAVYDGITREQANLRKMLVAQQRLQVEKQAMADEIAQLRKRVESAENEARVWKAISQQNSRANSQFVSSASQEGEDELGIRQVHDLDAKLAEKSLQTDD
eukprot:754145-Hanusia_phi.AAC.2